MAKKQFYSFFGQKRGSSHIALHVKRRRQGPEVMRPFDLYWWAKLNFGQELVFLEESILAFP